MYIYDEILWLNICGIGICGNLLLQLLFSVQQFRSFESVGYESSQEFSFGHVGVVIVRSQIELFSSWSRVTSKLQIS